MGYDIIDKYACQSLLTNCSGFPDVFDNSIINEYGLLNDMKEAYRIRKILRDDKDADSHMAECEVWAIYNVR